MADVKRVLTRRDFLRTGTCAAVGSLTGLPLLKPAASEDVLI